jgi:hypothetical protein
MPLVRLSHAGLKSPDDLADMGFMRERRSEVRMMCADMIEVCWKHGGKVQRATGLLEDISPSGACLQMECVVPPGTEVRWQTSRQEFSGIVRYCVYREIGYFIGVEFAFRSRWSKKVYTPQHLLELIGK